MATSWRVSTEVDIANNTNYSNVSVISDTTSSYIDWYISEVGGVIPSPTSLLVLCTDKNGNTKDQTDDSIEIDYTVSDDIIHIIIHESVFSVHGEFTAKVYTLVNSAENVLVTKSFYLNRDIREDIIDLNNDIEDAIAQIPPSYEDLISSIANVFDTSTSYTKGSYVWHDRLLYVYTADHPAGEWLTSDVYNVVLGDIFGKMMKTVTYTITGSGDWRKGYYQRADGAYANRNYYMCTKELIDLNNVVHVSVQPPEGYNASLTFYDSEGTLQSITGYVDSQTYPDQAGVAQESNTRLYAQMGISIGRFLNNDAAQYATNSEFTKLIKITVLQVWSSVTDVLVNDNSIVVDGIANLYDPQVELIKDITIDTDSEDVLINSDTNNQSFKLRELYVRISLPKTTTGTQDYIKTNLIYSLENGTSGEGSSPTFRYTSATSTAFIDMHAKVISDFYTVEGRCGNSSNDSQTMMSMSYPDLSFEHSIISLNGIRLSRYDSSSTYIPSGTRIKLYGIRI